MTAATPLSAKVVLGLRSVEMGGSERVELHEVEELNQRRGEPPSLVRVDRLPGGRRTRSPPPPHPRTDSRRPSAAHGAVPPRPVGPRRSWGAASCVPPPHDIELRQSRIFGPRSSTPGHGWVDLRPGSRSPIWGRRSDARGTGKGIACEIASEPHRAAHLRRIGDTKEPTAQRRQPSSQARPRSARAAPTCSGQRDRTKRKRLIRAIVVVTALDAYLWWRYSTGRPLRLPPSRRASGGRSTCRRCSSSSRSG